MNRCRCGSYAINPHLNGRKPGKRLELCDVCYWRAEHKEAADQLRGAAKMTMARGVVMRDGQPTLLSERVIRLSDVRLYYTEREEVSA